MSNPSIKRIVGPVAFAASAANIYNQSSALIYDVVKHIHISNNAASAATFFIYVSQSSGVETAGKDLFAGVSIPANATIDYFCNMKIVSTDFIVGHASATTVSIEIESEQYVV
jgi:hypothetical protein